MHANSMGTKLLHLGPFTTSHYVPLHLTVICILYNILYNKPVKIKYFPESHDSKLSNLVSGLWNFLICSQVREKCGSLGDPLLLMGI